MITSLLIASMLAIGSPVQVEWMGGYDTGWYDEKGSEIAAWHSESRRLFVVNGAEGIEILDLTNPEAPKRVKHLRKFGVNSCAVHGNLLAAAVASHSKMARGEIHFYDAVTLEPLGMVPGGYGPDMCTFTPDGRTLLVANEGEPTDDGMFDGPGSISIVDLSKGPAAATVREAGFEAFDTPAGALKESGVHLVMPEILPSQELEPEFITIDEAGRRAYVTLQENNAIAVIDIQAARVLTINPLGTKDHSKSGNGLDASDQDERIAIRTWPVHGLYQPDSVVCWNHDGRTILATANEGEARSTTDFREAARIRDLRNPLTGKLILDPEAFPVLEVWEDGISVEDLVEDDAMGRLKVSTRVGDLDGDGDFDRLFTFGSRSFSLWEARPDGTLVQFYDSGDLIERTVAEWMPKCFNCSHRSSPSRDSRSDDKGPEPEGLAIGMVGPRRLLFVGLERPGGVLTIDVTDPSTPELLDYAIRRDCSVDLDWDEDGDNIPDYLAAAGDLGPEGILFIPADKAPGDTPLLVVCNEISGTTSVFSIREQIRTTTHTQSESTLTGF
ncbi:MAG: choice-of-anchor I family protein [Planctomycetota bacterium]|nr:choice-of-anchor I family protein [Planctomycetota bacterium]